MKKQNQASKSKSKTTPKARQLKRAKRIHTGSLVWKESEFEVARKAGRFVVVDLTRAQWAKLSKLDHQFTFTDFLPMALNRQLVALQGAAPIYWTAFESSRPAQLAALRGPGPGGRDTNWRKVMRELIAAELKIRLNPRKELLTIRAQFYRQLRRLRQNRASKA